MNDKKKTYADRLETLIDNEIIEILQADKKSTSQLTETLFGDANELVKSTKNIIQEAIIEGGKIRASAAKKRMDQRSLSSIHNVLEWTKEQKASLLQNISNVTELTQAARNRVSVSEDEINEDIEDLIDLGIIDENGKIL